MMRTWKGKKLDVFKELITSASDALARFLHNHHNLSRLDCDKLLFR